MFHFIIFVIIFSYEILACNVPIIPAISRYPREASKRRAARQISLQPARGRQPESFYPPPRNQFITPRMFAPISRLTTTKQARGTNRRCINAPRKSAAAKTPPLSGRAWRYLCIDKSARARQENGGGRASSAATTTEWFFARFLRAKKRPRKSPPPPATKLGEASRGRIAKRSKRASSRRR